MKPAARITDMHVCPMVTGIGPHVGGPHRTGHHPVQHTSDDERDGIRIDAYQSWRTCGFIRARR